MTKPRPHFWYCFACNEKVPTSYRGSCPAIGWHTTPGWRHSRSNGDCAHRRGQDVRFDKKCDGCGHGYGLHSLVRQPLRILDDVVEFYESQADAPQSCTGYPDMMGGRCKCRRWWQTEEIDDE